MLFNKNQVHTENLISFFIINEDINKLVGASEIIHFYVFSFKKYVG